MKKRIFFVPLFFFSLFISCNTDIGQSVIVSSLLSGNINEYCIPGEPSLRGVDVINDSVVWISGSQSTFVRSTNGGECWESGKINTDKTLDFRDIHAFSHNSAIAISAGSPARIYKTRDGGKHWMLKYENNDSLIFFDGFDFCDSLKGIACSDPINESFFFIRTKDGGETWDTIEYGNLPKPLSGEAGFAASGTSVVYCNNIIMFGTGGGAARVITSTNDGITWTAVKTPVTAGGSFGIYSIATAGDKAFIITGGSWQEPDAKGKNTAISTDYGKSWIFTADFPNGFRSAIKFLAKSSAIICCGTNGGDISTDMGETWQKLPVKDYNALDFSSCESFIVFVGSEGRIGYLKQ